MTNLFKNLSEIKGGLSKKKVFRKFEDKLSKIVIDFAQDQNEFNNFINVYTILKKINISIPKIYEVYYEKNIIVMEDFGDEAFDKIYNEKKVYDLLKLAVDNLIIIQNTILDENLVNLEKYTFSNLKKEISEFIDYYLPYKKIYNFPVNEFYNCWERIYTNQDFEFDSFVHKDFEFINLIFINTNNRHLKCGIIDFQGAFIGFKGWDLFSVLENPRIICTRKYNESLIKYFYENITIKTDFETFREQYYLLNLARLTRILGRWIKLFKEGNKNFLNFVNPTKKRIVSSLAHIKDDNLKKIYEKYLIN